MSKVSVMFAEFQQPTVLAAYATDEKGRISWRGPVNVGGTTTIDLPDGKYSLRAQLPSGDLAIGYAKIPEDTTIMLRPERYSPREYLGWAYYLGTAGRDAPAEPLRDDDVALWVLQHGKWATRQLPLLHPVELHDFSIVVREVQPEAQEGFALYFSIAVRGYEQGNRPSAQPWLRVRDKFCALPVLKPTDVLVSFVDDDAIVTVGNENTDAQALLGYMDDGDFLSARTVGDHFLDLAEEILAEKIANPTAAVIAGYYLVRSPSRVLLEARRGERWQMWMRNLANWFDWIPDGAVIAAYASLRNGDVATAAEWCLKACQRGLPLYSIGLRLLADSLSLVATRMKDPELEDAADWVNEAVMSAARMNQTTMLRDDGESGSAMVVWNPKLVPAGAYR